MSQRRKVGCIDVVNSLEMKVSPISVDNDAAPLKSDVEAPLWQRSVNCVTTLQSCYFTKCLATSLQRYLNFGSANILVFLGKLPLWGQQTLKYKNTVES